MPSTHHGRKLERKNGKLPSCRKIILESNCGKNTIIKQRHTLRERKDRKWRKAIFLSNFLLRSLSLSFLSVLFFLFAIISRASVCVRSYRLELSALFTNTSAHGFVSGAVFVVGVSSVREASARDCVRSQQQQRERNKAESRCSFSGRRKMSSCFEK